MPKWFPLERADAGFFDSAPHVYRYRIEAAGPPEEIWASLISDESVSAWGSRVRSVEWTTPRPFGADSRRTVVLQSGSATVREQFFRWEEGRRYSFYVAESNRPGLRRFAEDYVVSATAGGSALDWTLALEARPAARLAFRALSPAVKAAFGGMAADGRKYFAARR